MNPTDKTEKSLRFGCGFVFGLFLFGLSSVWFIYEDHEIYLATVLVSAIVFGLGALRFGDAFWRWLASWLTWFG